MSKDSYLFLPIYRAIVIIVCKDKQTSREKCDENSHSLVSYLQIYDYARATITGWRMKKRKNEKKRGEGDVDILLAK